MKFNVEKLNNLEPLVISQINHYFKTGERLYNLLETCTKVDIHTRLTAKKYVLFIIKTSLGYDEDANLIYELIFGKITTSYHSIKKMCDEEGMKLLTSQNEWFDFLKNRDNKPPTELDVMIEYLNCGHKTSKIIHNIKKRGCDECRLIEATRTAMQQPLLYKNAMEIAKLREVELISSKQEFKDAYEQAKKKTKPTDLELKWKCKKCGNNFTARYSLIAHRKSNHLSSCPDCGELNNQLVTHKIAEFIFKNHLKEGTFFESNYQLNKIFQKKDIPTVLSHYNVHVDSYAILKIKNRTIKLAIERQGRQHQDSEKGWQAYLGVSRNSGTYSEWRKLIERDNAKTDLFKIFNDKDYYLIVIPHIIEPNKVFKYLIGEFELQTGIKIKKRPITWKSLFGNEITKIDKFL